MVIAPDVRKTSLRLTIGIFQRTVWYLGNLDKLNAGANENCEKEAVVEARNRRRSLRFEPQ